MPLDLRSEPAIKAESLVKDFPGRRGRPMLRAVDGVSLVVPRGQVCALLGPNGAGKTTTIQMLLGLTTPTTGTVHILGRDMARERSAAMRRVGFMASYGGFAMRLRVHEALTMFAELYELVQPRAAVDHALADVGITHLADSTITLLSSGQQTLVGLAKALLHRPELLVLDEPTSSLDPENARIVRTTIMRRAREDQMAVLITSHNMVEVERMSDRVVVLAGGRIVEDATAEEIRDRFGATDLEDAFLAIAERASATASRA